MSRLVNWIRARLQATAVQRSVYLGVLLRAWGTLSRWARVTWVARVSAVSVLAGFLLMNYLPQARDVFADTAPGLGWWLLFFLTLFWLWAVPVHYAARRVLAWEDWAIARDSPLRLSQAARDERGRLLPREERERLQELYDTPVKWVPRLLGLACFGSVYLGLSRAAENLEPAKSLNRADEALAQIASLQVGTLISAVLFFVFICYRRDLMAGWLNIKGKSGTADYTYKEASGGTPVPARTEYAVVDGDLLWFRHLFGHRRRQAYYNDAREDLAFDLIVAGLILVISVAFLAAFFYPFDLSGRYVRRAVLVVFMLGAWVLALTYLAAWSHRLKAPLILIAIIGAMVMTAVSNRFHDVRQIDKPTPHHNPSPVAERQKRLDEAIVGWKELNGIAGRDCRKEDPGSTPCPRPIIVAGQGGASRAAFFTATVLGHLLDLTRKDGNTYADFGQRLFAISSVSGSSLGAVVFRAALADASERPRPEQKEHGTGAAARGAKVVPATQDEKARRWKEGPCVRRDDQWFDYKRDPASFPAWSWRDCLQIILAGDFLSPVFVGLAFRDHLSIAPGRSREPLWPDRATLLEEAWERRYQRIVTTGETEPGRRMPIASARLAEKFGYDVGPVKSGADKSDWMPLLFLNGSSVTTGRRIIVSDVEPWYCGSKLRALGFRDDRSPEEKVKALIQSRGSDANEIAAAIEKGWPNEMIDRLLKRIEGKPTPFQLYAEAYDFFELRSGITNVTTGVPADKACLPSDSPERKERAFAPAADIRMSTAATLSARFPIISPHGVIRNLSGDATDYVVDGGYFENDGLVTANDIAKALMAHGLRPVILRVTNEPEPPRDSVAGAPAVLVRPRPPAAHELGFFQGLLAPLLGLYQTRAGHGVEAAKAVFDLFDLTDQTPGQEADSAKFLEIKVYDRLVDTSVNPRTCTQLRDKFSFPATLREISMSWWLSQPVQQFLDAQLCHERNLASIEVLKTVLKKNGSLPQQEGVAATRSRSDPTRSGTTEGSRRAAGPVPN